MAKTGQDAIVYRGAAWRMEIELLDEAGQPMTDVANIPLFYRVALASDKPSLLVLSGARLAVVGHVVRITGRREESAAFPPKAGRLKLYHELYTTDNDATRDDDHVFMAGTLTVLNAQIAQHAPAPV